MSLYESGDSAGEVDLRELFMASKIIDGGVDNYQPICTYLSNEQWQEYINNENVYVIDCADGNTLGLTPIAQ